MEKIKKHLLIAIILFLIIVVSYPLLMGAAYGLANQDDRVMSTIRGIEPLINILYLTALFIGLYAISSILWCMYYGKESPKDKEIGEVLE